MKENPKYKKTGEAKVTRILKQIRSVEDSKRQQAFERMGEKICKMYRNADALNAYTSAASVSPTRVMLNVLWSNVQIQKPLLYARMPKVVVERRHKDSDPIGKLAAQVAERATSFMLETQKDRFNYAVRTAVEDRLLCGRGVNWIRYDADFGTNSDTDSVSGNEQSTSQPISDDQEEETQIEQMPMPNSERVLVDYVYWEDFGHNIARNWYEVKQVWKRAYMGRPALVKRFGKEIGSKVQLNKNADKSSRKKYSEEDAEFLLQAEVYEYWDMNTKSVIWVSDGYKEGPLDEQPDPLGLKDFFPCPIPLLATTTSDSTYPTPDYKIYERLADEADYVTKRLSSIKECIRMVGAHAASVGQDIKNILDLDDGQTWPIANWAQFAGEKGGLAGAINWFPFDQAVAALGPLTAYRDALLQQIDLITGIPDMVRGATDAQETAAAIQSKSHWVTLKAQDKQQDVQRFCRDLIGKIAEIIFQPGLFNDETIGLMCGIAQLPPDDQANYGAALQLLRDDRLATFRVDIETDSTVAIDEEADKQSRMEFLQALTQVFSQVQSIAQFRPELMDPMLQSAIFAIRAYRTGRPLEAAFEKSVQQIEDSMAQAAANPPEQPPDPAFAQIEVEKQRLMQDGQFQTQKLQQDMQVSMEKLSIDSQKLQLEGQSQQMDFEIKSQQLQIEGQKNMTKAQLDAMDQELARFKEQFSQQAEMQRLELEKYRTVLDEREKMIEENRLKQEQSFEAIRLIQERSKEMESSNGKTPTIHIHNGSGAKEVMMSRLPTGELIGRTKDIEA